MKNELNSQGYSQEEEYFYRKNRELIDQRRKDLDRQKVGRASQSHPHWMRCPKCGEQMTEIDMSGIKVDQCTECQGIYFDAGELQTLVSSQEPKSFLGLIRKRIF